MKKKAKQKDESVDEKVLTPQPPEAALPPDPEDPLTAAGEDQDIIPDGEEPFETPPYEPPIAGEGP
jgi:hypothetical protein